MANHNFGYDSVDEDIAYGGSDAKTVGKRYRGNIIRFLDIASKIARIGEHLAMWVNVELLCRVPMSRLQTVWIKHTMNKKVGKDLLRGVLVAAKKRVSIAEAMITKASTQSWDNPT